MLRIILSALMLSTLASTATAAPATPSWSMSEMDTSCSPCRDFYQFANGTWQKSAVIPPSESGIGSFLQLSERNQERLRALLGELVSTKRSRSHSEALLATYWGTCLDSVQAETLGMSPLQDILSGVDGIASAADLSRQLGWLHAHGTFAGFTAFPGPDTKRSDLTILSLNQGGLGLPDRDYYLKTDSTSVALRAEYRAHVERTLRLAGSTNAAAEADKVVEIETALANASMTNVQRRDPIATYNKVPADTLRAWTPGFDWAAYATGRSMKLPDSINVSQPAFFRALAGLATSRQASDWQAYLRWQVVNQAAPLLTRAFVDNDFAFRRRLSGQQVLQPRWRRCLRMVDQDLGDALGQVFVAKHFPPAAKQRAQQLVDNVEAALAERITQLDWMSDETKRQARIKLDAIADRIGYPDVWRDYKGLEFGRGSLPAMRLASQRWEMGRQMARLGGPVEKREWRMSAPTVNAFYSGSFNSINFPAGILQPPFFSPDWDDALNYGGIGAVIGHEISHGFDDRGRQFDANGNLRDWWQPSDAEAYKARAQRVVEQFDQYSVAPGVNVNGRLTLGENIADLGGLAIAYAALQRTLGDKPRVKIDGFTPEQRFFLSHARVWRRSVRPEAAITQVKTDPHSPGLFRVNGPLGNLEEFQKAFGCKQGDAMVRDADKRARIW